MGIVRELLVVPTSDPDDERRARLLTIVLMGMTMLIVSAIAATLMTGWMGLLTREQQIPLLAGTLIGLIGIVAIYWLNRSLPVWVASSLFILLIVVIPILIEEPHELVNGRSLFVFSIPILLASVLLRPHASFFAAGLIAVLLSVLSFQVGIFPNLIAILGFFAIALVSWLAARNLEEALRDLRRANLELDKRVDERTHDLVEALAREHGEAAKNQAILQGIGDGVIVFQADGQAALANPAIGRILDRPVDTILGRGIEELMRDEVSPQDQEMLVGLLQEMEQDRSSVQFKWGKKTLSVSFAPVRANGGQVTGTVAVFRDYTHEAEVDRLKSDFVSIVSHELRTPLTSIKGYLDLLLMGASGEFNKQQQSFLQIAKDNAERLHELVSDLLDLSRLDSGRIELDVQVVSLAALVERVVTHLKKEYEDRGLSLTVELPENLPEVFADSRRVEQILTNLLSNACKYTQEGGATVRAGVQQGQLLVEVVDTGVGISAEDQAHLFTRSFRADDSAVRQQTGTGLGLNITKSLVELHGGQIWVDSELGQGSTFRFTLPLPAGVGERSALGEMGSPATTGPRLMPSGPWIMVVDDDADVAGLFKFQLEKEGFRVAVVTNGNRVVSVARQLQPELITLDLLMDVDGLRVLQSLKEDPATSRIPVVVVSVLPEPDEGLVAGAADYLVKPLDEGELLRSVRRILSEEGKGHKKILVVDDEIDIVGWLKHSLIHFGYDVTEAYDGVQALAAVAADKPDLILLDLKMPRMDGPTTIRRLREDVATRDIPIIVLSANPLSDDLEQAHMAGMGVRKFLRKPVTIEQLVAEVQKQLAAGRAAEKVESGE
jgi:PAS domain S-box-containing protein